MLEKRQSLKKLKKTTKSTKLTISIKFSLEKEMTREFDEKKEIFIKILKLNQKP